MKQKRNPRSRHPQSHNLIRAAHDANNRAVLAAYGLSSDTPEPEIVALLFSLYSEKLKGK